MIEIYVGSVGSGKSLHALYRAWYKIHALKNNLVVANFPLSFTEKDLRKGINERYIFLDDETLTPKKLIEFSLEADFFGKEGHTLLIIDEAQLYFNSREWQLSRDRKEWIKFFTQSRKFGYDIILITQDVRMIDRQIRSIAEYIVKHVKLRNFKYFKFFPVQIFAAVSTWTGGSFRPTLEFFIFKKWIAKRYDTMRIFK